MRFRSFAPYTLPGVLALIGWWWYISRKKARPAILQTEEEGAAPAMGLLSSPTEGSNGLLEKARCQATSTSTPTVHRRPSRDRPKATEPKSAEQEVVVVAAQVHSGPPLARAPEAELEPEARPEERLSVSTSPSPGLGRTEAPKASTPPHLRQAGDAPAQSSVVESQQQQQQQTTAATEKSSTQAEREPLSCSAIQQTQAGMGEAGSAPPRAAEATAAKEGSAEEDREAPRPPAAAPPHAARAAPSVELTKDERPEPEGEVAAEETPHAQLAPKTPQETHGDVSPCPSSVSASPVAKEEQAPVTVESRLESSPAAPETPTAHHVTSPLFTSTPTCPDEAESKEQWQVENGIMGQLRGDDSGDSDTHALQEQEYKRIAAGLITEVISAAAQQVQMTGTCEAAALATQATQSQAAPVLNGRPYSTDDSGPQTTTTAAAADQVDAPAQATATRLQGLPPSEQSDKEMINGCLTAPTWERRTAEKEQPMAAAATSDGPRERDASRSKLQADDAQTAVEDSGCCQSEDGLSSEDLHDSGLPQVEGSVQAAASSLSASLGSSKAEEARQTGSPAPVLLEEAVLAQHEAATALQHPHLTVASLRNGAHAASEAEADQSGGGCTSPLSLPAHWTEQGCVAYSALVCSNSPR